MSNGNRNNENNSMGLREVPSAGKGAAKDANPIPQSMLDPNQSFNLKPVLLGALAKSPTTHGTLVVIPWSAKTIKAAIKLTAKQTGKTPDQVSLNDLVRHNLGGAVTPIRDLYLKKTRKKSAQPGEPLRWFLNTYFAVELKRIYKQEDAARLKCEKLRRDFGFADYQAKALTKAGHSLERIKKVMGDFLVIGVSPKMQFPKFLGAFETRRDIAGWISPQLEAEVAEGIKILKKLGCEIKKKNLDLELKGYVPSFANSKKALEHEMYIRDVPNSEEANALFIGLRATEALGSDYEPQFTALRDAIIHSNLRLALTGALKHTGGSLEDAFQSAMLGLTIAVDKYDPWRGAAFSTYARSSITNGTSDNYRDNSPYAQMSSPIYDLKQIYDATVSFLGPHATPEEIAAHIQKRWVTRKDVTAQTITDLRRILHQARMDELDAPLQNMLLTDSSTMLGLLEDKRLGFGGPDALDEVIRRLDFQDAKEKTDFTEREEFVMHERFWARPDEPDVTFGEIGKKLGFSRQAIEPKFNGEFLPKLQRSPHFKALKNAYPLE
ncbi:RNA polymerase sigma factor RpoD [Candidatus Gugararchaeum adminiculabundum]|nr:RNA polymerase sigma factor RpoD [Candidatus Gugararchaeum adminiculabundum]